MKEDPKEKMNEDEDEMKLTKEQYVMYFEGTKVVFPLKEAKWCKIFYVEEYFNNLQPLSSTVISLKVVKVWQQIMQDLDYQIKNVPKVNTSVLEDVIGSGPAKIFKQFSYE